MDTIDPPAIPWPTSPMPTLRRLAWDTDGYIPEDDDAPYPEQILNYTSYLLYQGWCALKLQQTKYNSRTSKLIKHALVMRCAQRPLNPSQHPSIHIAQSYSRGEQSTLLRVPTTYD